MPPPTLKPGWHMTLSKVLLLEGKTVEREILCEYMPEIISKPATPRRITEAIVGRLLTPLSEGGTSKLVPTLVFNASN